MNTKANLLIPPCIKFAIYVAGESTPLFSSEGESHCMSVTVDAAAYMTNGFEPDGFRIAWEQRAGSAFAPRNPLMHMMVIVDWDSDDDAGKCEYMNFEQIITGSIHSPVICVAIDMMPASEGYTERPEVYFMPAVYTASETVVSVQSGRLLLDGLYRDDVTVEIEPERWHMYHSMADDLRSDNAGF